MIRRGRIARFAGVVLEIACIGGFLVFVLGTPPRAVAPGSRSAPTLAVRDVESAAQSDSTTSDRTDKARAEFVERELRGHARLWSHVIETHLQSLLAGDPKDELP